MLIDLVFTIIFLLVAATFMTLYYQSTLDVIIQTPSDKALPDLPVDVDGYMVVNALGQQRITDNIWYSYNDNSKSVSVTYTEPNITYEFVYENPVYIGAPGDPENITFGFYANKNGNEYTVYVESINGSTVNRRLYDWPKGAFSTMKGTIEGFYLETYDESSLYDYVVYVIGDGKILDTKYLSNIEGDIFYAIGNYTTMLNIPSYDPLDTYNISSLMLDPGVTITPEGDIVDRSSNSDTDRFMISYTIPFLENMTAATPIGIEYDEATQSIIAYDNAPLGVQTVTFTVTRTGLTTLDVPVKFTVIDTSPIASYSDIDVYRNQEFNTVHTYSNNVVTYSVSYGTVTADGLITASTYESRSIDVTLTNNNGNELIISFNVNVVGESPESAETSTDISYPTLENSPYNVVTEANKPIKISMVTPDTTYDTNYFSL